MLAIIFVVGAAQAYNYAWNVGLPSAARSGFKEDPTAVFALTTVLGVILVAGSWIIGKLADGKSMSRWFLITRILAIPSVFLMLMYVQPGIGGFAAVLLGGSRGPGPEHDPLQRGQHVPDAQELPRHRRGPGLRDRRRPVRRHRLLPAGVAAVR